MAIDKFMDEYLSNVSGFTTAEDLLAGLMAHQGETGAVGQQLMYILLGAGITPPSEEAPIQRRQPVQNKLH